MNKAALILNSIAGTALYFVTGALAFVMSPFLVHHLGNGGYGFWELLMGLVGYLGVLDMGVGPAVVRHVALARGQNDHARLVQVVNTGFATFLIAGVVGALLLLGVSVRPTWLFGSLPLGLTESRHVIAIAAILFLLTFTRSTFNAALMGFQCHRIINSARLVLALFQAGATYWLLSRDDSHALRTMASISLVTVTAETLFAGTMLFRILGERPSPRRASLREGKELFRFGAKSAGIMAANSLVRQGLLFVISHGLGTAQVTFYVLCGRLIEYGSQFVLAIGYPITPYLASALGAKGLAGARESYDYTTRAMQFIQAGIAMGVLWLGLPFLAHWMGPEYARRGAPVFYCLVTSLLITVIGSNSSRMLLSLNRHGKAAVGSAILGVCAFLLALILVPHWGLTGAAACAATFTISQNLMELILVSRALQTSLREHVTRALRQIAPALLASSAAFALFALKDPPITYGRIFAHAATGGGVYVVTSFFTMLNRSEREHVLQFARRRLRKQAAATAAA